MTVRRKPGRARMVRAMSVRITLAAAAAAILAVLGGVSYAHPQRADGPQAPAALAALTVAPDGPMDGYERDAFGSGWLDLDGDCRDTRAEVLAVQLADPTWSDDGCRVLAGTLTDPYSGRTAAVTWRQVDVDHVVALGDAWRSGAAGWTRERREAFANDSANLLAAGASENRSKGDDGPDAWSPPTAAAGACTYAYAYVTVKARWGLTVTAAERDALAADLAGCPTR